MTSGSEGASFTGRSRQRKTRRSVFFKDRLAQTLITFGGLGTIVAVSLVFVFLVSVAWPLFGGGDARASKIVPSPFRSGDALWTQIDEYRAIGWRLERDGTFLVFRASDGEALESRTLAQDERITAHSFVLDGSLGALGFADGGFRLVEARFESRILERDEVTARMEGMEEGEHLVHRFTSDSEGEDVERVGVLERTPIGQIRLQWVEVSLGEAVPAGEGPLVAIDVVRVGENPYVCAWAAGEEDPRERLRLVTSRYRTSMSTGETTLRFARPRALPCGEPEDLPPRFLAVSERCENVYLVWSDGRARRIVHRPPEEVFAAESLRLVPDGVRVTTVSFLLGRETLLVGRSDGQVDGWFLVPYEGTDEGFVYHDLRVPDGQGGTKDARFVFREGSEAHETFLQEGPDPSYARREKAYRGLVDVLAQEDAVIEAYLDAIPPDARKFAHAKELLAGTKAPVTRVSSSLRTRIAAVTRADGTVSLFHVTSENEVVATRTEGRSAERVLVTPKEDAIVVFTDAGIESFQIDLKHPEATPRTLFRPVWYEGRPEPVHEWQSTAGSDEAETKLGLMPTVYGTLKATIYSFLFGAPLAILAAMYTSEFLRGRARSRIKAGIEMMASLPSVVLGFLAAIVVAPVVDAHLAGTLAAFVCVPFTFVLGGYLWRLLPYQLGMSWSRFQFPILFFLGLPLGILLGTQVVGPLLERFLFLGDLKTYLHGAEVIPNEGKRFAGWLLILLPVSALTVSFAVGRLGRGLALRRGGHWTRRRAGVMELVRFGVVFVSVIGVAALFANVLSFAFDPRGENSILNTYDQRNALVVGFIMGFAIIPIIYTIAEDALSTVPEHLRAASLGAGATPWQTAVRIVVPTAMSGLFSAMMIGLGRAVGETMIIVMATGGTPIMEPNLFNGFRTLSANIATELPEAAQGSTHYRTLFLAALVLFVMTFVLNTLAELVRLRFRKKAFEL